MKKIYYLLLYTCFCYYAGIVHAYAAPNRTPAAIESNALPKNYIIEAIQVEGNQFLDKENLIAITGLQPGDVIQLPGEALDKAIKRLWKQGLVAKATIYVTRIVDDRLTLTIEIKERRRLANYFFEGIKKKDAKALAKIIPKIKGNIVTEAMLKSIQERIKGYFIEKGYLYTTLQTTLSPDTTLRNGEQLKIHIDKGEKIHIHKIFIEGNEQFRTGKLKRKMKGTRQRRRWAIFSTSRFIKAKYEKDKGKVINFYKTKGFIDAHIVKDTLYRHNNKSIDLYLYIKEGPQYVVRNIVWTGNYLYDTPTLQEILAIKKGDVYNPTLIQQRLHFNPKGGDISSLYMDKGYFDFQIAPIQVGMEGNTIDLEMRIHEGAPYYIHKVTIKGNTRTNDHVIRRELKTLPGEKFDRAKVIRSQREIAQLNFFAPEKINILPLPNPADSTLDLAYHVVERPSDQIELSGGWGGGLGFIGSLGIILNNFSLRDIGRLKRWRPLPTGDGQTLVLRASANGQSYQNYAVRFVEPWLGGKRFNTFSIAFNHSIYRGQYRERQGSTLPAVYTTYKSSCKTTGFSTSWGRRLQWPDDYCMLTIGMSYYFYKYKSYDILSHGKRFSGYTNNLSLDFAIERNSIDHPIYPKEGALIGLYTKITPPYSLFSTRDVSKDTEEDKLKWIEYQQYMLDGSAFTKLVGKLVLNTRAHFGILGNLFSRYPIGPFERFYMGGGGLSGHNMILGSQVIPLRGYMDNSIVPQDKKTKYAGGIIYNKFVCELRYPITLNAVAPVYILAFAEGGNNWIRYEDYNPFDIKSSVGLGIRVFTPMFGMLGFDWGYGFHKDIVNALPGKGQWHISIGKQLR